MHLDLKPQNVLLSKDTLIKLADFGSAQMFYQEEDSLLKHRGTYEFLAPECFRKGYTQPYSGRKVDVWALGMTVYVMTFGSLPFEIGLGVDTHKAI